MTDQQKQRNWFARHKILTVVLAFVIIAIIGGAAGGSDKTDTTKKDTATHATTETKSKKWDIEAAYAKVTNGMTKAQVEEAVGKQSDNCTENQSEYIGKTEFCTYGNAFTDKGTITVTYSEDVVSSKTKNTY